MEKLLNIKNLSINYEANDEKVMAVTDLEIELAEGETLGLVGETGAEDSFCWCNRCR